MDFCVEATIWIAERLQAIIGTWHGGQMAGAWQPARTICMSEYVDYMVSTEIYAEFGPGM